MNNKTVIGISYDVKNYTDIGMFLSIFASVVMVINTLLNLCNSSFPTQPHSIILKLLLIKVPYSDLTTIMGVAHELLL